MNKFRNNLHFMFFDLENSPDNGSGQDQRDYLDNQSKLETTEIDTQAKTQEEKLKENVSQNYGFGDISEDVGKVASRYPENLKKRFETRVNDKKSEWYKKITEGFGHLIMELERNHYFDGDAENVKQDKIRQIKEQYTDEVKKQYEKVVLFAGDNKYKEEKDVIFGKESKKYPANIIYCKLTGAATIFKVDRQYTEGYKVDLFEKAQKPSDQPENTPDTPETEIDRKNRQFLSNDLPEYLWNIRKTPGVLNVIKWLPIFSVKVDRPSEVDRDAISDFLKAANRLPVKNGKSPVMVLLEALHDNTLNTNSTIDTYAIVLQKHGMDLDGFIKKNTNEVDYKQFRKCMSEIMKVGSFYINTQRANNDVKDQHAIYLSVLKIIETSGGADKAVDKYKATVEKAKSDKKTEKKEGYEAGKGLSKETLDFAKKLGITDFTSVTRLFKKEKDSSYFKDTSAEKILANINNDSIIDARDTMVGGTKTGSQFLEIFNRTKSMIGEDKVFNNLLDHAKLINQTLELGLDERSFTKEEINGGNKELILLLQDIISKPGEDLFSLMLGETGAERVTRLNAAVETENEEIKEKADAVAKDFVEGINYEEIKQRGLKLPTPEEMQSGLAATLYSEYKRGVGLGGKISFDDWVKGLELNTGVQVREDGKTIIGIGLDYHKVVNLGKGWTLTPELAAGAFIPLFDAKPDGSGGVSVDVAKSRLTPKGTVQSIGLNTGVTYTIAGVTILSAGINWNRDKAAGIEKESENKKGEMQQEISKVLEMVRDATKVDRKNLDLTNTSQVNFIKSSLENLAKRLHVSEKDIPNVVDATMRLLAPYNGVDLKGDGVIKGVASGVAEQFAMAWSEYRKAHVSESAYLSGANLGAFWVVGSPLVGIYAGVKFNKHDLDGYGDRYGKQYSIDNSKERTENGIRTPELLQALNARLGLSEGQGLNFVGSNKAIKIPKSIINRVKISESMKKFLVKDGEGNILVSSWTKMGESIVAGAATQSKELVIGEGNSNFVSLDTLRDDWFAQDIKEVNKAILTKENSERYYTKDGIMGGINKLKEENSNNEVLNSFAPTDQEINALIVQLNRLQNKDKIAKIIIERQSDGTFTMNAQEGDKEGKGLDLEYRAKLEMFDSKAKNLADKVYKRAATLNNPNEIKVLHSVKHPLGQKHKNYDDFVNNLLGINGIAKNLTGAKDALKSIVDEVNGKLSKEKQLDIGEIDDLSGKALEQALLSFNNLFARSTKVVGKGHDDSSATNMYEFTHSMGSIIEEREKQIGKTMQDRITATNQEDVTPIKNAYASLMKAMSKHRDNNEDEFNTKSAKAAHLDNAVGFNLGDQNNPENPLFNPEIYDKQVDLKGLLGDTDRDILHRRAIENFIHQPALFQSIKDVLSVKKDAQVKIEGDFAEEGGKQTIGLDIGGKIFKFKSDMKFGYFTQCVNHTIILENIQIEDEQGNVTNFVSGSWENGVYREGNKVSQNATTTFELSGSAIVHDGRKKNQSDNSAVKTEGGTNSKELPTTQTQIDNKDNQKVDIDNTADSGNNNYSYEEL